MLYLYTGAHQSGKTTAFLQQITALASVSQGHQLLIVPEIFSHAYERQLADFSQNQAGRTAEVLSFTRLARMVFAQTGGSADTVLDRAGRLLTLHQAVRSVQTSLRFYRNLIDQPAVIRQMLDVIDEMKTCCISPTLFLTAATEIEAEQPRIGDKITDLAVIATAYDRLCAQNLPDPRDVLDRLMVALETWRIPADFSVYLDSFRSFTAQEMQIIHLLLQRGIDVHIALTLCHQQPDIYFSACKTFGKLRKFTAKYGIPCQEVACDFAPHRPRDLAALCTHGLQVSPPTSLTDGVSVHLAQAGDAYSACEHAAATILRILQQAHEAGQSLHWRDFAIAMRNGQDYAALLEIATERYNIPMFMSEKAQIVQRPPLLLIASALSAVTENFPFLDVFTCLKTGLCNLTPEEVDALENYASTWRIKGGAWLADWNMHPKGYGLQVDDAVQVQLDALNALRARAIAPFVALRQGLQQAPSATACAQALFDFLETQGTADRMEARAQAHEDGGRSQLAQEYRQLWEIIVRALEQCAWVCGDAPMPAAQFAALFTLVLSEYEVGTIPISLDRVNCGSMARVCALPVRYLIVLGCNDGELPLAGGSGGVLNEDDRAYLEGAGIELTAFGQDRIGMELELINDALACPTDALYLVHHRMAGDGSTLRPSYLLEIWRTMLQGVHDYVCNPAQDALLAPLPRRALAHAALGGAADVRAQAALLEAVLAGEIAVPTGAISAQATPPEGTINGADEDAHDGTHHGTTDAAALSAYHAGVWVAIRTVLVNCPALSLVLATDDEQHAFDLGMQVGRQALVSLQQPEAQDRTAAVDYYRFGYAQGAAMMHDNQPQACHRLETAVLQSAYQSGYRTAAQQACMPVQIADPSLQKRLYGNPVRLTASRVDTYYHCPFSYFMQYGLRAQPRKTAVFSAPEAGTFIHYVLEHLVNQLTADTTPEQATALLRALCEQYITEVLGGMQDKTARFRAQFYRLRDSLEPVAHSMLFEIQHTDFRPIDAELDFSPHGDLPPVCCTDGDVEVALSGKVDRVDGYIEGDRLHIRVMDYKSGKKSFSLSDLWHGLNLQLLIYLYAIREDGLQRYRDKLEADLSEIVPAGVLYVPAREPVLDGADVGEGEDLTALRLDALRRSGLLTANVDILHAMEHGVEGKSALLPFQIKTPAPTKKCPDPEPKVSGALVQLEEFGKLARYANKKLLEMGQQLQQGKVPIKPSMYERKSPCDYCDFAAACHFDPTAGDRYRELAKLKDGEVWEKMRQNE